MSATTNIRMNNNGGTLLLAPRFSKKTITMFVFAYLAMVTVILFMIARPFESETARDFGVAPQSGSTSTHEGVQVPGGRVPAAPYIIFEPVN